MNDQSFENLAKKYPALFEKSPISYMAIGDGWIGIIDALCEAICADYDNAVRIKQLTLEDKDTVDDALERKIAQHREELPSFIQIKEKFGGLRIYVQDAKPEVQSYITFAESMSYRVCEECGAPGEPRNDSWSKTLCDMHHRERNAKQNFGVPSTATMSVNYKKLPKISDDE